MNIKSSDTFFPTKFRPTTANTNPDKNLNSKSFKLVKKRTSTQQSGIKSINQFETINIFKNQSTGEQQFNLEKDRPVGGVQNFIKQHNKKNKGRKLSVRAGTPQIKKKQNQIQSKNSNFFSKIQWYSSEKSQQHQAQREEIFKSNYSYKPSTSFQKSKEYKQNKNSAKSQVKFTRNTHHDGWVGKQTEEFQTKMGVLNQIYYKRPLVQRYGDRYFQFFLRNRYEEDFYPPSYIHQIKSDAQAKIANNDKFISKIKKIHPNVRNFQKLVVKGRHFETIKQSSTPDHI